MLYTKMFQLLTGHYFKEDLIHLWSGLLKLSRQWYTEGMDRMIIYLFGLIIYKTNCKMCFVFIQCTCVCLATIKL